MNTNKQSKPRKITMKQERFAQEYIANGGNGTQAALAVYDVSNADTARAMAAENLAKPIVSDRVEQLQRELREDVLDIIRRDDVMAKAIASALSDLASEDVRARDSARKFIDSISQSHKRESNVTHDNRKIVLKYPK